MLETGYADELMVGHCTILYIQNLKEKMFFSTLLLFNPQGKPKIAESFSRTVKSIWRICRSNFGQVRVDFGLPFSLTVRFCSRFNLLTSL